MSNETTRTADGSLELFRQNLPTCPYCGYKNQDWTENCQDREEWTEACVRCDKDYLVQMIVDYDFTTEKL